MAQPKTWSLLLIAIQLFGTLVPSDAFHMFGGGGGGGDTDVTEILAAGLITKLLMEDFGGGGGGTSGRSSMFQALRHQVTSRFNLQAPRQHHPIQHMVAPRPAYQGLPTMMAPRRPMMYPIPPHILHHHQQQRHHQYLMTQAMMQQAHQHALATAWNNEYRALQGSESLVRSSFPALVPIDELLSDEDTLSVVTILLNSDLLDEDEEREEEAKEEEAQQMPRAEDEEPEFETSSSENESRYILPRIVRHFVERIMRRVEHHQ